MNKKILLYKMSDALTRTVKIALSDKNVQLENTENLVAAQNLLEHKQCDGVLIGDLSELKEQPDLLSTLKRIDKSRAIILKGEYDSYDEKILTGWGFFRFLRKPFDKAQLISSLEAMLASPLVEKKTQKEILEATKKILPVQDLIDWKATLKEELAEELRRELRDIAREYLSDYAEKHFYRSVEKVLTREVRRLSEEKNNLLREL